MKLSCPGCSALIPAADVNLDTGWAKCAECDEVFALAEQLPGYTNAAVSSQARPERPFNARAVAERTRESLSILVPAEGMRAGTWALLGFATFWTGFIAFWTAGALGFLVAEQDKGQIQWPKLIFASFSIPFWLVGFGMLGAVVWSARSVKSLGLNKTSNEMEAESRCGLYRRRRQMELDRVQHARPYSPTVTSENRPTTPSHGVEVIYEDGSFLLPADSEDEQKWLMFEINDFLEAR